MPVRCPRFYGGAPARTRRPGRPAPGSTPGPPRTARLSPASHCPPGSGPGPCFRAWPRAARLGPARGRASGGLPGPGQGGFGSVQASPVHTAPQGGEGARSGGRGSGRSVYGTHPVPVSSPLAADPRSIPGPAPLRIRRPARTPGARPRAALRDLVPSRALGRGPGPGPGIRFRAVFWGAVPAPDRGLVPSRAPGRGPGPDPGPGPGPDPGHGSAPHAVHGTDPHDEA